MALCTACGSENAAGSRFCGQCAAPLPRRCPACGVEASPDQRFCAQCAAPLTASPPGDLLPAASADTASSPETAPPEEATSELRWASVLFVDLVGYTSLTEGWDAGDVREMLSGYFEVARTVVARYAGSVEKFIGDAVVAVWGSQEAREDDPERCVRAGLEVVEAVVRYGEQQQLAGLAARAGVVTGQVAAWSGSADGLVAGDRVNLAARVQSAADAGSVFVDEVTMRATRETVAYSDAGQHALKGIAEPLGLWRAVRIVAGVGGAQRVDGLEAVFVGRARELTMVKELFHATVEGGRARLVAVSGVAGIGKSRLSWEFEKYADGLATTVFWHRGRCLSYGDGVAFWALAEMIRQRFGIAEDDSSEFAAAKLTEGLPQWVPDAEEREFVAPRLGVLVGAVDRDFPREELFAGWRLFLERLAAIQPVVLLLEDLHWADSGLLDFVEYLLDWSAGLPIYFLAFARPELAERRPGWLADRRSATTLHLDPLPDPVIAELLDDLVPGMPEEVKAKISAQAGGIPLYAVESIRSLVDRDLVVPRGGVYCLVGDVGDLDVPASLTSVIAARLDCLPPAERELVKGLAVLGDSFSRRAVPAVSEAPEAQLDELLRDLVRKEILTVRSDPLSPERGHYAFLQTMLRDVAHGMLSRRERKSRHQAVAALLRATFADDGADVAEVIAAHYSDAYHAAGTDSDASGLRAEAAGAFERAGERAAALGSPDTAERHYRSAADLAVVELDEIRYMVEAARMAGRSGRSEDAVALLEAATEAHLAAGRDVDAARLAGWLGDYLRDQGRLDTALRLMEDALEVLEREHADDPAAELHASIAALLAMRDPASLEATEHLDKALASATALELPDVLARALNTKSLMLQAQHRVIEASALYSAAADVASTHDLKADEGVARVNLGDVRAQSDLPAAEEQYEQSFALASRLGMAPLLAIAAANLALLHFYAGRWDETDRYARQAIEGTQVASLQALGRFPLVLLLTAQGDLQAAENHLAGLFDWAASSDRQDRVSMGIAESTVALAKGRRDAATDKAAGAAHEALQAFGMLCEGFRLAWPLAMEAALSAGRLTEAAELLELVANAPKGHVPPYLRAQLARYRALLNAAQGEPGDVEANLREAVDALQKLGYAYWLARAQSDLGRWLGGQGRQAEAEPLLADAAETFTRLGATPDLQRVQPVQLGAPQ